MRTRKVKYCVEVELPEDITVGDMRQYIEDCVRGWKGGLPPDDPITQMDRDDWKVRRLYRRRRR